MPRPRDLEQRAAEERTRNGAQAVHARPHADGGVTQLCFHGLGRVGHLCGRLEAFHGAVEHAGEDEAAAVRRQGGGHGDDGEAAGTPEQDVPGGELRARAVKSQQRATEGAV